MDEITINVTLEEHKQKIGSLQHRMDAVEKATQTLSDLTLAVSKIANSLEYTNTAVTEIKSELVTVKKDVKIATEQPIQSQAEEWSLMKRTIMNIITTSITSLIIGGILWSAVQAYIK